MKIAVDFDGTIVEHRYPDIGREIPFATATIRLLIEQGHKVSLWSVREGQLLEDAVVWCAKRGIEFYAVNANYPGETPDDPHYSRKLKADLFIDDRNIGGLLDWGIVAEMISKHKTYEQVLAERKDNETPKKKWWQF